MLRAVCWGCLGTFFCCPLMAYNALDGTVAGKQQQSAADYLARCESSLNQLPRVNVEVRVDLAAAEPVSHYLDIWEYGVTRQFFERRIFYNTGKASEKVSIHRFAKDIESGKVASMTSDDAEGLSELAMAEGDVRYRAHMRPIGGYLIDLQPPIYLLRVGEFDLNMMSPLQLSKAASVVRYAGTADVGGVECVIIEMLPPQSVAKSSCTKLTLFLDPQHGYLPRRLVKESLHENNNLHFSETLALGFQDLGSGAFLPTEVKTRDRMGGKTRELSRYTITTVTPTNDEPRKLSDVFFPNQLVQLIEEPFDPRNAASKNLSAVSVQVVDASGALGRVFSTPSELQDHLRRRTASQSTAAGPLRTVAIGALFCLLIAGGSIVMIRRRAAMGRPS